jgi:hypothetical protein
MNSLKELYDASSSVDKTRLLAWIRGVNSAVAPKLYDSLTPVKRLLEKRRLIKQLMSKIESHQRKILFNLDIQREITQTSRRLHETINVYPGSVSF